ncbi:polysaccharide pyruvyl transferase family protein [Salinicola endophyticus]|uniref:Polysaccharide pyruvyl transferase family protein n=1 Tax=Salinicola endophyticus TaxID=1949083 RepID=A0ABY8FEX6_9GAMM|nr:polysaccharide pyruvyl transferase family protein [Salinicola endophyticus]WFF41112.1 polysaccharide pyruvyl transferase family protein [Salinicola endophyticus]
MVRLFRRNGKREVSESALTKSVSGKWVKTAFIFNDTRPDLHFGCDRVMDNLLALLDECRISPRYFYGVGQYWEFDPRVRTAIAECDVVIVNGEGSIHHSNRRARSLSRLGKLAKSMGKPAVLLNCTLFKNKKRLYKDLAYFDQIYARDLYSVKEAAQNGLSIAYAPDLTFFSDFGVAPKEHQGNDVDARVLVGDSVIEEVANELSAFAARGNACFLDIVHGGDETTSVESHVERMRASDLVVTGRFHTVCFCLNAGVPFVALESNTNKISSLLDDCLKEQRRVITVDELKNLAVSDFLHFTEGEVAAICAFKDRARAAFSDMQSDVSDML